MVNGINGSIPISSIYNSNCGKKVHNSYGGFTNPIDRQTMSSLECLGIYNMALVNGKENFEHKPAKIIADPKLTMNDIQGEKVFKPNGNLDYILEEKDNVEIKYYPNRTNSNNIDRIKIYDINTGNLIKEQETFDNGEGYIWGYNITEYPQHEPNVEYSTRYDKNLTLTATEKLVRLPNGTRKTYSKEYLDKKTEYFIKYEDDKNKKSLNVTIDDDKNIKEIDSSCRINNVDYHKDINMNKGAILSVSETKSTTVPNYMEHEVLNDTDVKPAPKYDISKIDFNTDGEKTYYQDGNTKTITKADGTKYVYNTNGTIKTVITPNKKIELDGQGGQTIEEYLGDNISKRSQYNNDNSVEVHYTNGNITKEYEINSNGIPTYYAIFENGKHVKSAGFSDEGYLLWYD